MVRFDKEITKQDNIIVVVGIDGAFPEDEMKRTIMDAINSHMNKQLDMEIGRDTVRLSVAPTGVGMGRREKIGMGAQYIQQYDVRLGDIEARHEIEDAVHNEIVEKLEELGFIIEGTWTKMA